jgi:hypothetical protein
VPAADGIVIAHEPEAFAVPAVVVHDEVKTHFVIDVSEAPAA